jgi:hypothetical protein
LGLISTNYSDIYLIGENSKLKLLKLRRIKKDSVQVLDAKGKVESTLTGTLVVFRVFGRVIWRGSVVKASETKRKHSQHKHLLLTGRDTTINRSRYHFPDFGIGL